jgi:hypothetical protein
MRKYAGVWGYGALCVPLALFGAEAPVHGHIVCNGAGSDCKVKVGVDSVVPM